MRRSKSWSKSFTPRSSELKKKVTFQDGIKSGAKLAKEPSMELLALRKENQPSSSGS